MVAYPCENTKASHAAGVYTLQAEPGSDEMIQANFHKAEVFGLNSCLEVEGKQIWEQLLRAACVVPITFPSSAETRVVGGGNHGLIMYYRNVTLFVLDDNDSSVS